METPDKNFSLTGVIDASAVTNIGKRPKVAESLVYTKFVCKYHKVFTSMYRCKIIYRQIRVDIIIDGLLMYEQKPPARPVVQKSLLVLRPRKKNSFDYD